MNTSFEVAIKIINEAAHAVPGRVAAISDEADEADEVVVLEANKVVVFKANKAVVFEANEAVVFEDRTYCRLAQRCGRETEGSSCTGFGR